MAGFSERSYPSSVLGEDLRFGEYVAPGADAGSPTVVLLHGRGNDWTVWTQVAGLFDEAVAATTLPPFVALAPDAPWLRRASFFVDSEFTGDSGWGQGRPVESALVDFLRVHRPGPMMVAGYSMGGYGALRLGLAHPDLFGAIVSLSPACYHPDVPQKSSVTASGAFGRGDVVLDMERWHELNYPALLAGGARPAYVFIGVGDEEPIPPDAPEQSMTLAAARAHNHVTATGIETDLRIIDGGHDWNVWTPLLMEGLERALPLLG